MPKKKRQTVSVNGFDVPKQLSDAVVDGDVLFIVGTGVSIGSTRAPCVSWRGLLENGLEWCVTQHRFEKLVEATRGPLKGILPSWQARNLRKTSFVAASEIERLLGGPEDGDFANWLESSVGQVKQENRDVLDVLCDLERLGIRLATTNYDTLLEDASGLTAYTWRDQHQGWVQKVVRGKQRGIFHIHGVWTEPESVVFMQSPTSG